MSATEQAPDIYEAYEQLKQEVQELRNKTANNQEEELSIFQERAQSQPYLEPKVSLPEKFDGSRHMFRGFTNQVRLVTQLQARCYPTDADKIGLIGTLLKGPALAWFAPLLETSSPLLNDLAAFGRE